MPPDRELLRRPADGARPLSSLAAMLALAVVVALLIFSPLSGATGRFQGTPPRTPQAPDLQNPHAAPRWSLVAGSPSPPYCESPAMTYDGADRVVLMFGCGGTTNSTWAFTGGAWKNITPLHSPSPRQAAVLVYDPKDGYVVLFGGFGPSASGTYWSSMADTWTFRNGTWTNITSTASGPSPRDSVANTYDKADGYLLLFAGHYQHLWVKNSSWSARVMNDTWSFSGGHWTNRTGGPTPSVPYVGGELAFDPKLGYVVYYYGTAGGAPYRYTFSYIAGVWTRISTTGFPDPWFNFGFTYDPTLRALLLFGGAGGNHLCPGGVCRQTWKYSNTTWTQLTGVNSPTAREGAPLVWDLQDKYIVMYGGYSRAGLFNQTWIFR